LKIANFKNSIPNNSDNFYLLKLFIKKLIDQITIQRIIDSAEIVDVIEDFVSLKKRGTNFLGLCPFHNEKTPSFIVSPGKGIFKCFGCGKGGNAVHFVMEHEHLTYPDALKFLAKKYQIPVEEKEATPEEIAQINVRESLLILNSFAQKYFSDKLMHDSEGISIGLAYLKERGFQSHIVNKFQLGYSPEKADTLSNDAVNSGYKKEYLLKTGLSIESEKGIFDRFRGRVMFPVHNLSGRVVAFGGRILKANKEVAKYLNSPESEIYHKSDLLYGIFFAKNSIVKLDSCYLVEGYTDVISLHQNGIENVVASSGTSLTQNQIRLINRFTKNITVLYDGDMAGIKASFRSIDMILEQGMNVKVLLFPDGDDPDSFSKKVSATELQTYIEQNQTDFIRFKSQVLLDDCKNDPIKRATIIQDIVKSIAIIPDMIIRAEYVRECSILLNTKEDSLYFEINKIHTARKGSTAQKTLIQSNIQNSTAPPIPSYVSQIYSEPEEKEIISFLFNFAHLPMDETLDLETGETKLLKVAEYIIKDLEDEDLEFQNMVYRKVFEDYQKFLYQGNILEDKFFIHHEEESIRMLATDILSSKHSLSKFWEKGGALVEKPEDVYKQTIPRTLIIFKLKIIQVAIQNTHEEINQAQKNNDLPLLGELMTRFSTLCEIKKILAEKIERILTP